jgi:hypothetical protein
VAPLLTLIGAGCEYCTNIFSHKFILIDGRFYMNLPICGAALTAVLVFMRVEAGSQNHGGSKLKRVDWIGNFIFIPSVLAVLLGLVMGGVQHPWSSWRIIVPIVLGAAGWIVFHVQQSLPSTKWPSVPARLFSNRTSACAYILTFTTGYLVQSVAYFFPVWLQAILGTTVLQAGVKFLPTAIGVLGFAIIGGVLMSKFGKYRTLHAVAFIFSAIGFGLFTILTPATSRWAVFQLVASVGLGILQAVLLPAIMAGLPESDVAVSAAVYSFIRTFGMIWGVTIPSIVFNATIDDNLHLISSATIRGQMVDGAAYSFASQIHAYRSTLSNQELNEILEVYTKSLNVIWWVGLGVSIFSLLVVAGEKDLKLRDELETEYGIEESKKEENLVTS